MRYFHILETIFSIFSRIESGIETASDGKPFSIQKGIEVAGKNYVMTITLSEK